MISGWFQAETVVANIALLLNKEKAASEYVPEAAGIHLSLGIVSWQTLLPTLMKLTEGMRAARTRTSCSQTLLQKMRNRSWFTKIMGK